ncbi:MAG: hypothetical protein C0621_07690 [Desulfuromonas sp.]|nr:MAG: hypothetical protein C0621_07690 [Desulfuromonas sp.]
MLFIPLSQVESVELVVNALKIAGGEADCTTCPAYRVCTKQCVTIANAVEKMIADGTLPGLEPLEPEDDPTPPAPPAPTGGGSHLRRIK